MKTMKLMKDMKKTRQVGRILRHPLTWLARLRRAAIGGKRDPTRRWKDLGCLNAVESKDIRGL